MKGKVQEIIRQMYLSFIESMKCGFQGVHDWQARNFGAGRGTFPHPLNEELSHILLTGNLIKLSFARQRVYIHFTY